MNVAGIGSVVVDHVMILSSFPKEDTKTKAEDFFDQIGGPVPTALLYLHQLGYSVNIMTAIGDDATGLYIEKYVSEKAVDTNYFYKQSGKQSGFAQVWINRKKGLRTTAYHRGSLLPIPKEFVNSEFIKDAKVLHIDGTEKEAVLHALEFAEQSDILVTLDTGDPKPDSELFLKKADVVIAPKSFAQQLFGVEDIEKAAEKVLSFGPKVAVVTNGEDGLAYSSSNGTFFQESFKVDVVDSNGAGDIFSGAFIHCLLSKKPLLESIKFASAAAAIKCTKMGKEDLPSKEEIEKFLKMQNNESL